MFKSSPLCNWSLRKIVCCEKITLRSLNSALEIERMLITIYGLRILTGDRAEERSLEGVELQREKASKISPHTPSKLIQGKNMSNRFLGGRLLAHKNTSTL
jgi:hypothetical protein